MRKNSYSPEFREEAIKMVLVSGKPIAVIARDIGVHEGTLTNWVNKYRREHPGEEKPLEMSERARLRELENENRELRMERDFLKKAAVGSGGWCNMAGRTFTGGVGVWQGWVGRDYRMHKNVRYGIGGEMGNRCLILAVR